MSEVGCYDEETGSFSAVCKIMRSVPSFISFTSIMMPWCS